MRRFCVAPSCPFDPPTIEAIRPGRCRSVPPIAYDRSRPCRRCDGDQRRHRGGSARSAFTPPCAARGGDRGVDAALRCTGRRAGDGSSRYGRAEAEARLDRAAADCCPGRGRAGRDDRRADMAVRRSWPVTAPTGSADGGTRPRFDGGKRGWSQPTGRCAGGHQPSRATGDPIFPESGCSCDRRGPLACSADGVRSDGACAIFTNGGKRAKRRAGRCRTTAPSPPAAASPSAAAPSSAGPERGDGCVARPGHRFGARCDAR